MLRFFLRRRFLKLAYCMIFPRPPETLTPSAGKNLRFHPRFSATLTSSLDQVLAGCLQALDHSTPGTNLYTLHRESKDQVSLCSDYHVLLRPVGGILDLCIPLLLGLRNQDSREHLLPRFHVIPSSSSFHPLKPVSNIISFTDLSPPPERNHTHHYLFPCSWRPSIPYPVPVVPVIREKLRKKEEIKRLLNYFCFPECNLHVGQSHKIQYDTGVVIVDSEALNDYKLILINN
ncbi:hypothetical protein AMECASPLE_036680 [Ameca splendens]|uniref:Uncharacterized protein n=1 Tax=Ameca splendens TaxID=208324 RepID=A0ABV1AFL2_9TELE